MEKLRKRSDYLIVGKSEQRVVTPAFIIQFHKRSPEGPFRVGITASRKVGGAVERNRAKRRLRALVRQYLSPLGVHGMDYVLVARRECLKRPFAQMGQELERALRL